ncbi:Putative NADPH-quinone reductase (modulator of drug activity B) [Paenibacillus sp. UNC496MF]|uniref:NAD(P)H-dependent oxidoreductase n=1 Tax=Paenibacillus sp. UNC496MF TaxID=1502753 RepID=UPI0008E7E8BA|nr:NAD(P)H-dependent oxidoreductase [Paenibacillus sp. UNC496MF]SFI40700.1 Putative NADPH-quinone reductase (modulator of drug activity B) [Paenibacillus sp. UNC496MF]
MKTLIIVTHPNLEASNWNKAWVEELKKQSDITIHDLYKEYPDERIDVQREQRLVEAHDRIIFQYPLYWYSTPPLLKKWFDAVLLYNWAYGPEADKTTGKQIGVAISTYGTAESYQPTGSNRYTLDQILAPVQALARFISAVYLPHFAVNDTSDVTPERLAQSSKDYVRHLMTVQPAAEA